MTDAESICLICGATEPCMTEADLNPGDPGVPCTFDPEPHELLAIAIKQAELMREMAEALRAVSDVDAGYLVTARAALAAYDRHMKERADAE